MVIIVCGLQGTGKTYVSRKIAETLDAVLLRTDVIRKNLLRETTYKAKEIGGIYEEMFKEASGFLKNNPAIVLDATFSKEIHRHMAEKLAREYAVDFLIILVTCDEEVIRQRIQQRAEDESDADFNVYLKCKALFEPIAENHITIDNSGTPEETQKQIEYLINQIYAGK